MRLQVLLLLLLLLMMLLLLLLLLLGFAITLTVPLQWWQVTLLCPLATAVTVTSYISPFLH
jgi:hypothetical protein